MNARMKPAELAIELNVTRRTIENWAKSGKIPCVRLSPKNVRFNLTAVLDALGVPEEARTAATAK